MSSRSSNVYFMVNLLFTAEIGLYSDAVLSVSHYTPSCTVFTPSVSSFCLPVQDGTKTDFNGKWRKDKFESSVVLDGTKTRCFASIHPFSFESSVVLDGTKTDGCRRKHNRPFESSVVLDGTKTFCRLDTDLKVFESSVVLDGTKTMQSC